MNILARKSTAALSGKGRAARFCCLALALCLTAACLALPLHAADAVPQAVLDARGGVVRVVTMYGEDDGGGYSVGTGFAVGEGEECYIVTNYHVVEGGEEVRLYYKTGKYVGASVRVEAPERDLCVLEPEDDIPELLILPLQADEVDTGKAVYALGFPGAADMLSGDWERYDDDATNIVADKNTLTVTDGIISAVRDNNWVGTGVRTVQTIQTNAAISGGNSGGPLLDSDGSIVGINTMSVMDPYGGVVEGMHAAVHVAELERVLTQARIPYKQPGGPEDAGDPPAESEGGGLPLWTLLLICTPLLALAAALTFLILRRRKKSASLKNALPLDAFERSNRKVEATAAFEMARRLVQSLLPLANYDLNPLMRPDNILIGEDAMALRQSTVNNADAAARVYPGYSAPEAYGGMAGQAATVYFIGGVLYTLLTGRRPADALARRSANSPVFPTADALQTVVNQAMEPWPQNRIPNLQQLARVLDAAAPAIYSENI